MKKTILSILLLFTIAMTHGQTSDSAAIVVDRYVSILNMKELPKDSMILVTSIQIDRDNPTDTTIMLRWDAFPNKNRTEVWYHNRILDGFLSDGISRHKIFDTIRHRWKDCLQVQHLDNFVAYDIRGPFYYWRTNGAELKYLGTINFQNQPVHGVELALPNDYVRQCFFEKESGMLFLYKMTDRLVGDSVREDYITDWRAYHEYQRVGKCIFPKVESYQNMGHVYIIHHQVEVLPYDERVFNQDRAPKR